MLGVLRIYWYYFSWQRTMAWTTYIGIAFFLIAAVVGRDRGAVMLVAFGFILAIAFPLLFAGFAYRQLISNRRCLMLPNLGISAAVALLLLTLTGVAGMLWFASSAIQPAAPPNVLALLGLFFFCGISLYVLLLQWACTQAFGLPVFVLLLIVVTQLGHWFDASVATDATPAAGLLPAVIVCAGWVRLFVGARSGGVPRGVVALPVGGSSNAPSADVQVSYLWLPRSAPAATAPGSILRGARDGWANRVLTQIMFLFFLPFILMVLLFVLGHPVDRVVTAEMAALFVMAWSFFGHPLAMSVVFSEWPARMRLLWLRTSGGRQGAWRLIERTLFGEVALTFAITATLAVLVGSMTAVPTKLLAYYVTGCVAMALLAAYAGLWVRAARYSGLSQWLFVLFVHVPSMIVIFTSRGDGNYDRLGWLLLFLGGLAFVCREQARRHIARIDWCAVRPARRASRAP
jgi:hypothetical protein